MKENKLFLTSRTSVRLTPKDVLGLLVFVAIPLSLFVFNLVGEYRIVFYAILVIFIAAYTLVGQFFFERARMGSLGKKLLALTVINTLVISLVNFTGNTSSPYYFVLYFLIFSVAIFVPIRIFIFECLIVFASVFVLEFHKFGSVALMFQSLESPQLITLFSIPATLPLLLAISSFVRNLEVRRQLLTLSRDLLAIEDIEDEAVLAEINQGIMILDPSLTIVKVSRWIENNFETTSKILLGKKVADLGLYDAVSNKKLLPSDHFYKNLTRSEPQTLKWRVLYKSQYGKYKKFVIKQTPLMVGSQIIGVLLSVQHPPKSIKDIITSFNQLFSFRLASNIAMIKNLVTTSDNIKSDPAFSNITLYIERTTQLLNDVAIKNEIADGDYEVVLSKVDLQIVIKNVIEELGQIGSVSIWNISPLYKNRAIPLKTDASLCEKILNYSIKGVLYLSKDSQVNLSLDEDDLQKKPTVILTADIVLDVPGRVDLTEPFFAGKFLILAKYKGTGLEFSNANLMARFLGFDFSAEIKNKKLIVKLIF